MVLHETNSPFSREQAELLNKLLPTLTDGQRFWLCGYLAATLSGASAAAPAPAAQAAAGGTVASPAAPQAAAPQAASAAPAVPALPKEATVLYGSQTGNSKKVANQLAERLKGAGYEVTVSAMNDFKTNALKKVTRLFIVVSTHGEGEPPDNALSFYEFLHSKRAPRLDGLPFSVLALGDTSYEKFCQTGKDFDKRLEELGGRRIAPRVDCDVDFEDAANGWIESVLAALADEEAASAAGAVPAGGASGAAEAAVAAAVPSAPAAPAAAYSRSNPFRAAVLENLNLNGRGSDRETRHVELSLEGSGLTYEPGDALGIYPENRPQLVEELIEAAGWKADEPVPAGKDGELPLREALIRHYEITVLTKPLLEQAAELTGHPKLKELTAPGREQALREYIAGRDLVDLIRDFELKGVPAKTFVPILRKIPPRLYSIASSLKAHPDEAHLTIRKVVYEAHGRTRYGVCSTYVAERAEPGSELPVFVQQNENFRLPADPDAPIIMIGPGTGVAPFRAFLEEREETGAGGKSWLFFGDRHFFTDFLYQVEWQRWLKNGVLTRMDVAFSRDQERKIYVQHRMLEKAKELYAWLEEGAYVYVCGDKSRMAQDVHAALETVIRREGGLSEDEAAEYLKRMQQERRYQRDVY
ncbi:MAG: sulfite reductase [NADPH] flavoprotein, alpha-component [Thermobacillus sp. ZCTH02-B1]|uniref:assimilatory sulfite reductase (NADPH) flavoprotein subunit n=1 Tax=Thermobacillus sp. ZCTH02-B1 TaxID=1858795 RepID=UPI000B57A2C7|nr:assimilatory sulfite reductase (NADPH) flavoprotein subunit [Thermobacillus sp. ZCTH02-B1]OUM97241.1 MAG: sulfite reductase [NADPH] flavoprotein, alpha-component [Thermobacillus sp. ZCTH02-B1]